MESCATNPQSSLQKMNFKGAIKLIEKQNFRLKKGIVPVDLDNQDKVENFRLISRGTFFFDERGFVTSYTRHNANKELV